MRNSNIGYVFYISITYSCFVNFMPMYISFSVICAIVAVIFSRLITNAKKLSTDLFSVQAWKKWCNEIFNKFDSVYTVSSTGERWTERKPVSDTAGENPALEVMRRESSKGYHGSKNSVDGYIVWLLVPSWCCTKLANY